MLMLVMCTSCFSVLYAFKITVGYIEQVNQAVITISFTHMTPVNLRGNDNSR